MVTLCCAIKACTKHATGPNVLRQGRYCCPVDRKICHDHPLCQTQCVLCKRTPCDEHMNTCLRSHTVCVVCSKTEVCDTCKTYKCPKCPPHTDELCKKRKCMECSDDRWCKVHEQESCPVCGRYFDRNGFCNECVSKCYDYRPPQMCKDSWRTVMLYIGAFFPRNIGHAVHNLDTFRVFEGPIRKRMSYNHDNESSHQRTNRISRDFIMDMMYLRKKKIRKICTKDLHTKFKEFKRVIVQDFHRTLSRLQYEHINEVTRRILNVPTDE
jgi:hypothetical protein